MLHFKNRVAFANLNNFPFRGTLEDMEKATERVALHAPEELEDFLEALWREISLCALVESKDMSPQDLIHALKEEREVFFNTEDVPLEAFKVEGNSANYFAHRVGYDEEGDVYVELFETEELKEDRLPKLCEALWKQSVPAKKDAKVYFFVDGDRFYFDRMFGIPEENVLFTILVKG